MRIVTRLDALTRATVQPGEKSAFGTVMTLIGAVLVLILVPINFASQFKEMEVVSRVVPTDQTREYPLYVFSWAAFGERDETHNVTYAPKTNFTTTLPVDMIFSGKNVCLNSKNTSVDSFCKTGQVATSSVWTFVVYLTQIDGELSYSYVSSGSSVASLGGYWRLSLSIGTTTTEIVTQRKYGWFDLATNVGGLGSLVIGVDVMIFRVITILRQVRRHPERKPDESQAQAQRSEMDVELAQSPEETVT